LNKYEALLILPEMLKDTMLEESLGRVKAEIKKLGGDVESVTRLGKRAFARTLKKQVAGHYAILSFTMPGDQIRPLQARLKLSEDVFRVQVVRAPVRPPVEPAAAAGGEGKAHGVA
jgi:ribosomal protein S6